MAWARQSIVISNLRFGFVILILSIFIHCLYHPDINSLLLCSTKLIETGSTQFTITTLISFPHLSKMQSTNETVPFRRIFYAPTILWFTPLRKLVKLSTVPAFCVYVWVYMYIRNLFAEFGLENDVRCDAPHCIPNIAWNRRLRGVT